MSFKYGAIDTAALAGVEATLTEWPSLGGLGLETLDIPNGGRFLSAATQTHTEFEFLVDISGPTPQETFLRRDNFIGALDPEAGPRDLTVEQEPDWLWRDVMVANEIRWSRLYWRRGVGFKLTATVTLQTVGGTAEAVESAPQMIPFTSTVNFTNSRGNTACHPTVEFPAGAQTTVNIGSFSVVIAKPKATSGTAVLDYENFEFYIRNTAGQGVELLTPYMGHFDRPSVQRGALAVVSCVGAPAGTRRLYPNYRRK